MPPRSRKTTYRRKPRTTVRKPRVKATVHRRKRPMRQAPRGLDYTKPMPAQLNTKFRYVSNQKQLITGVAGVPVYIFRLNSCFDPDWSGTGHQPLNWDQITPFYAFYRVNAIKFIIRFFGGSTDGIRVGYKLRNSQDFYITSSHTASAIRETQNHGIKIVNTDSPARDGIISRYVTLSRLQGISKIKYGVDDGFSAGVNANPDKSLFLDVFISGPLDNSSGYSMNFTVEIILYTTMYALKTQQQS